MTGLCRMADAVRTPATTGVVDSKITVDVISEGLAEPGERRLTQRHCKMKQVVLSVTASSISMEENCLRKIEGHRSLGAIDHGNVTRQKRKGSTSERPIV